MKRSFYNGGLEDDDWGIRSGYMPDPNAPTAAPPGPTPAPSSGPTPAPAPVAPAAPAAKPADELATLRKKIATLEAGNKQTSNPLANIQTPWKRALVGGLLGSGMSSGAGPWGALGGGALAAILSVLLKPKKPKPMDEVPDPGVDPEVELEPETAKKARGGSIGQEKNSMQMARLRMPHKRRMRFQDGGGVPASAGFSGLPGDPNMAAAMDRDAAERRLMLSQRARPAGPTANPAMLAGLATALGFAPGGGTPLSGGPPPGAPAPGGGAIGPLQGMPMGGPPPGPLPGGPIGPPQGPPPGLGVLPGGPGAGAALGMPMGGPPPGGPIGPPQAGPNGLPALQSSLQAAAGPGAMPSTPGAVPAGAGLGATAPDVLGRLRRGLGGRPAPGPAADQALKKGGTVKPKGRAFGDAEKTAENLPPAPVKAKKGGMPLTRKPKGPKISIAIVNKRVPPPPTPEDDDMDAPPPPAPLAKAKGGKVAKKKGGACKMARGGAAKVRKGFPKTNAAPKRLAAGGKVRGCGAATKGTTFSGIY